MIHIVNDMSNFENDYENVMKFTPTVHPSITFQSILEYELGVDMKRLLESSINPLQVSTVNGVFTITQAVSLPTPDIDFPKSCFQRILEDIKIVEQRENISRYKSIFMRLMLIRCIGSKAA